MRLVTEEQVRLFQYCPAYLQHYKDDPQELASSFDHRNELQLAVLRKMLVLWLKRQQLPQLTSLKKHWQALVTKQCQIRSVPKQDMIDLIVDGIGPLVDIHADLVSRGLQVVSPKIVITLPLDGVVLQTEPEGILTDRQGKVYIINYSHLADVRTLVNDLVIRGRLAALHTKLNKEVILLNYALQFGLKVNEVHSNTYTSRTLCKDHLFTNLKHVALAISNEYNVPLTQTCMGKNCPYIKRCYL